jgi:glycosyltransferase involved in cell wall biosynthesis
MSQSENAGRESIFRALYSVPEFHDRFAQNSENAVDVVIPVMHTNELWRANLCSIYREVPVNRLIVSDDGCVDDSIEVVRTFPRVVVLDHRKFISLGYSLRKLIESVQTEWFVYLHSDVYLAQGWFDAMRADRERFDWFESRQHTAVLAEVPQRYTSDTRPYSGAQMGRKAAFETVLPRIDDDYLYRNEDIILAHMIGKAGFRYGRAETALIYHQQMEKKSRWLRDIQRVDIEVRKSAEEELREKKTQLYGILKYMGPDPKTFEENSLIDYIYDLRFAGQLEWAEFHAWVEKVNPGWWPMIRRGRNKRRLKAIYARVFAPYRLVKRAIAIGVLAVLRKIGY